MGRDVSHLKQQVGFLLVVKKRKQKRLERSHDNLETQNAADSESFLTAAPFPLPIMCDVKGSITLKALSE